MSEYSEDAKIVDESTSVRLQELEVEQTRIRADKDNYPHKVTIRIWATVSLSIAGIVIGMSWFIYETNIVNYVENTKQKQAQAEIQRILADSERDLAQLQVDKLRQIAEIVRNSKSDELALKALAEMQ